MSSSPFARYLTATRYSVLEQARNRFALILLLLFVPTWYFVIGVLLDNTPVEFKFRATGDFLQVSGHNLGLLTAGLNAITLIIGFMKTFGVDTHSFRGGRGSWAYAQFMPHPRHSTDAFPCAC